MQHAAVELVEDASVAGAAKTGPVFQAELPAREVAEKGDVGRAPIVVHVRGATEVAVYGDLIYFRAKHSAHGIDEREPGFVVWIDCVGREALDRVEPVPGRLGRGNVRP